MISSIFPNWSGNFGLNGKNGLELFERITYDLEYGFGKNRIDLETLGMIWNVRREWVIMIQYRWTQIVDW